MSNTYYILDESGEPVPVENFHVWASWFETADRTVAKTYIGPVEISTVFLGLNHQWWDEGPPILFETLVFTKDEKGERKGVDNSMVRYATKEQALTGHEKVVMFIKGIKE